MESEQTVACPSEIHCHRQGEKRYILEEWARQDINGKVSVESDGWKGEVHIDFDLILTAKCHANSEHVDVKIFPEELKKWKINGDELKRYVVKALAQE